MTIDLGAVAGHALRWIWRLSWWCAVAIIFWIAGNAVRMVLVESQSPERAAAAGGRWITAHDTQLHVVERGDSSAPVLVLVAGTGAWAGTWRDSFEPLVRAGWRVLAVDLPPFGFSHRPANADYSRQAQARRLLALIRDHVQSPVVLLGHSYGGGPAAEAAALGSQYIRHLVLVDAAIGLRAADATPCAAPGAIAQLLDWRPARTALVAATGTQPWLTGFWLRQFVTLQQAVTEDRLGLYRAPLTVRGTSAAIGDWAAQFAAECEEALTQRPAGFAHLRMPLTLLWGTRDAITPIDQALAIAAATPAGRLVQLPDVGHIPQIENVDFFNRQLIDQLAAAMPDLASR